jgi:8-oxo-dGTP diphosphatase
VPANPNLGVGVALILTRVSGSYAEILMGKRKGSHGAGTWSFPGGWMDHGETPPECAARELHEETGLLVSAKDIHAYNGRPYTLTNFGTFSSITLFMCARLVDVQDARVMEPEKCEAWDWFHPSGLPTPLFKPLVDGDIGRWLRGGF